MPVCCRFFEARGARRIASAVVIGVLVGAGGMSGCRTHEPSSPDSTADDAAAASPSHSASEEFTALLDKGDYAAAIRFVERSGLSTSEKAGVTGGLILDGWADPAAASRPPYPLAAGFDDLERAALSGRRQSVTDLSAKFATGINYEGKNVLMAPSASLAACWDAVAAATAQAATCIALRHQLKLP